MIDFLTFLSEDEALHKFNDNISGLAGLTDVEETLLLSNSFKMKKKTLIVVKENLYSAQQLFNRLYPLLQDDVLLFAVEDSLRVEELAASPNIYGSQMDVLTTALLNPLPKIVITHPSAIIRYLPSKEVFNDHIISLKINEQYNLSQIKQVLIESGYRQVARIDQPLTFSMRGGVIDVFSIQYDKPIRIEFFDDEIESMRFFDISNQKTIKSIDQIQIVPASTLIYKNDYEEIERKVLTILEESKKNCKDYQQLRENVLLDLSYLKNHFFEHYLYRYQGLFGNQNTILDYFSDFQLVLSNWDGIKTNLKVALEDNQQYIMELFEKNRFMNYHELFADFDSTVEKYHPYIIESTATKNNFKTKIKLSFFPLLPLDNAVQQIIQLSKQYSIIVVVNEVQRELIEQQFRIMGKCSNDYLEYSDQKLFEGFVYEDSLILTQKEIFGVNQTKTRFYSKFQQAIVLDSYEDLKLGDYVVHNQYGIGKYQGIITKEINGHLKDYLKILYRDDDVLMVPLEQFKLVRKFISSESVGIKLSKLGSNSWNKTKEKIEKEVSDIAEQLIKLYSAREEKIGFSFSSDDKYVQQFEQARTFELTSDQKKAIEEIKKDMESDKPMDRLLCGDVGFGKTEVAMVAAFKAVKDLKQVAYLCPTTILSMQHYNTFVDRFKNFPVKIKMLNRFVPQSAQKQIIRELKEGKIDILIGTHRLLSDDVEFADLGLLIIDEEQRFGVSAKEKIKQIKNSVDVLSLSATPIPRTLQMSLVGVMNLSQLQSAPSNRIPIQTYVVEKNEKLVKEVIERELARNGQVFYLHNNVSDIYSIARKISVMVKDSKVAIAHGQMSREEIEDVMYRFITEEYNILICTTIIETGIDIPNVNTIIIEEADHFGLSQLYQIRGRVGRSNKVAYAYLMYKADKQLSEVASKRLQAIKDFTELGSGYKIAMRDLAIRGAGDLLGEKQAGFINTIGMSLYLDILNKAIKEKQGEKPHSDDKEKIRVKDINGYIPKEFVSIDNEKISIYQKLDTISDYNQLMQYYDDLTDFYGKLPKTINDLFLKKQLELLLNASFIEDYQQNDKENVIVLSEQYSNQVDGVKLFEIVSNISQDISLKYRQRKIYLSYPKRKNYLNLIIKTIQEISKL